MADWEFGGEGINPSSCTGTGQVFTHSSTSEPFFERSTEGFPCPYMAIRIAGNLFRPNGTAYGFQPGTEFKRQKASVKANPGGPCVLATILNTPDFQGGTVEDVRNVPDASYVSPYIVPRPDLGYNPNNGVYSYELRCDGSQGVISLYTVPHTNTNVSVKSASNSCVSQQPFTKCFFANAYGTRSDCSATAETYPGVFKAYTATTEVRSSPSRPGCQMVYPVVNGQSLYTNDTRNLGYGSIQAFITLREATQEEIQRYGCNAIALPNGKISDDPTSIQTTSETYDCINGQCVKNVENKGYYVSLDLCQDNCGSPDDPNKICFTKAEYSAIVSKLNAIQGRVCR